MCKANYFLLYSTTIQFKTEKTIAVDTASIYEDKVVQAFMTSINFSYKGFMLKYSNTED